VHLVGFIIRIDSVHGHLNVKLVTLISMQRDIYRNELSGTVLLNFDVWNLYN